MSQYRDHRDAAHHRVEALESKLAERDAELAAQGAALAEREAEIARLRIELERAGPIPEPARVKPAFPYMGTVRVMIAAVGLGVFAAPLAARLLRRRPTAVAVVPAPALTLADPAAVTPVPSDRVLESYREALEKAPNDVDLKLRVGSTQVIVGHAAEAVKILGEVRRERPNSADANHFLGRAMLLSGSDRVEAMRYLELAAVLDPNRAEYHLYVGWAANELHQPTRAAPALNRAIELDHDLADAYWQRGVLLQREGASDEALRDLQTALEKRPSRHEAWATIALCYQDLSKRAEAEKAWRRAIAGDDAVAEWHYRLGKLLASQGTRAAALPELEKATELAERPGLTQAPWLHDAHLHLAEAYRTQPANKAKAIEHYLRFLALAPPHHAYISDAQEALAGLVAKPKR
jgi:tetratricopeptide (TPR) repeat protein